jgi:hypothetical protein
MSRKQNRKNSKKNSKKKSYYFPSTHMLGSSLSFSPVNMCTAKWFLGHGSTRPQFGTVFPIKISALLLICTTSFLVAVIGPTKFQKEILIKKMIAICHLLCLLLLLGIFKQPSVFACRAKSLLPFGSSISIALPLLVPRCPIITYESRNFMF